MVSRCRNCYVTNLLHSLRNTIRKINSHAYITKTYHEGKPLPIGYLCFKTQFTHVHFSDKLKPLRIGPYKILDRLSDVTYALLAQDGSIVHVHRNHLIHITLKNHSYIHICVIYALFRHHSKPNTTNY